MVIRMLSQISGILTMKTEKTEMIMKYVDVTYKVAKQYEIILKDKQLMQIKAWYVQLFPYEGYGGWSRC